MKIDNAYLITLRFLRALAGNCGLKSDKSPLIPRVAEVSALQTIFPQ